MNKLANMRRFNVVH